MLEIVKFVLSYNKRHEISCATGSSIVTISHLLSNGQNNPTTTKIWHLVQISELFKVRQNIPRDVMDTCIDYCNR